MKETTEKSLCQLGVRFVRNDAGHPSFRIKGPMAEELKAAAIAEVARRVDLFCALISKDQMVAGDTRGWAKWKTTNRTPAQFGECCHCGESLCFIGRARGADKVLQATHRSGPCFLCEAALEKATKIACVVPEKKISLSEAFRMAEALGPAIQQWVKAPWGTT